MAWNEPGGNNQDPWGGKRNNEGPPDLDEALKKFQDQLNGRFGGGALSDPAYVELVIEQLNFLSFADAFESYGEPAEGAAILARAAHEQLHPLCGWLENIHS